MGTEAPTQQRYSTNYPGVMYRLDAKGDRRYIINYMDSAGKRVFKTVPGNLKDAVRERAAILERMHRGKRVVRSNLTVEDLAEDYLRTQIAHLKPKTVQGYQYAVDHWVIPRLGSRKISELDVHDIANFIVEMRKPTEKNPQGYKRWTIQNCLTPMSCMFRYAVRRGWMADNPIRDLERQERPKNDQAPMRILSSDEISLVMASVTDTYKPLLATAIFSGLRMGELLRLRWEDIDLLKGVIIVRESKTSAGVRQVSISPFLLKVLAGAPGVDGEVFKTRDGGPMKARRVGRALEETLKRAGVDHVRFHDLRHTYASILISQGDPITYVAQQMGHAKPEITLRVYGHLWDGDKHARESTSKMEAAFSELL